MKLEKPGLTDSEKEAIVRQFLSYCRTAMRYECYDFYREQRHLRKALISEGPTPIKHPKKAYFRSGFEVEEYFLFAPGRRIPIRSARIFKSLLLLEESRRSFLLMRFWLEMSCSEIAKALGYSRSTAYRIQNSALSQMENLLTEARV